MDNFGHSFPSSMESFQQRILTSQSPDGSYLGEVRELLGSMYELWDPLPANGIAVSAMDFFNGCLMEQTLAIRDMRVSHAARSWPYYLRNKTGTATAYAFMLFPRELEIDVADYIQVIDDIALFINLTNDILS